jgi:hypothetical protein
MIMGASASSVWYNLQVSHPTKEAPVIDYKLALLFQPMLMLGITIGVELSVIFPYWLITVLIIILFVGNHRLPLACRCKPVGYCYVRPCYFYLSCVLRWNSVLV